MFAILHISSKFLNFQLKILVPRIFFMSLQIKFFLHFVHYFTKQNNILIKFHPNHYLVKDNRGGLLQGDYESGSTLYWHYWPLFHQNI